MICSKKTYESLDECRRMLTSVDGSLDKCKPVKKPFLILMDASEDKCSIICGKFVLHFNRCTVITQFFNLNFVRI